MTSSIKIEQLNSENYSTWKIQIKALLKRNKLWGYVSGEKPKPVDENLLAEWLENDEIAESEILLTIHTSELRAFEGCGSSMKLWDKLKETYESKGAARQSTLLKKCVTMRMQEGDDLRKYIGEFCEIIRKLKEIDLEISEQMLVMLLTCSLPDSFNLFKESIETRDTLPTFDALKIKLLERNEGRSEENPNNHDALYTKKTFKNDKQFSKNNITCHRCGKIGHLAKNCYSKEKSKQYAKYMKNDTEKVEIKNNKYKTTFLCNEEVMYTSNKINEWCLDSGCTSHMCNQKEMFHEFKQINVDLALANNQTTKINGTGNVQIVLDTGKGGDHDINLEHVSYVSDLRTNLFSVSKICDHGFEVIFRKNEALIIDKNKKVIIRAYRRGNLYFINQVENQVINVFEKQSSIDLWHVKLGHLNEHDMKAMVKTEKVYGMHLKNNEKLSKCDICLQEKQTCKPFNKISEKRTNDLLEIVHSDVCGPMRQSSFSGKQYFVTFIDDYSRWCEIYFIKHKNEVFECFKQYKNFAENFTGKKIKFLQSDNGKEYCNNIFDKYLEEHGIRRRLTVPYTPQQNGIAERKNRTLVEMTRCIMRQAGAPPRFWAEAIHNANYVRNRSPTKALNGDIPYKFWTGKTPSVIHLQMFGVKVYVLIKNANRGKFDSRSEKGIFLGYSTSSKAYRVFLPKKQKTIVSRDVQFLNQSGFNNEYDNILSTDNTQKNSNKVNNREKYNEIRELEAPVIKHNQPTTEENVEPQINLEIYEEQEQNENPQIILQRKKARGRPNIYRTGSRGRPRKIYHYQNDNNENLEEDLNTTLTESNQEQNLENNSEEHENESNDLNSRDAEVVNLTRNKNTVNQQHITVPATVSEALQGKQAHDWKISMQKEYDALIENNTWEMVELPENKRAIGCKWVFTLKRNKDGSIQKFKSRLVAKGCSQKYGIDYKETFSPVVRYASIRMLISLACEYNLYLHQMDVTTAYLNGSLHEDVYMNQPEGFVDRKYYNKVLKLKKSLYGLKQSGREWNFKLDESLKALGFKTCPSEPCVYTNNKNGRLNIIAVYVDDIILACSDKNDLNNFKTQIASKFKVTDGGQLTYFLGMEIDREGELGAIQIGQKQYINNLLEECKMSECKPIDTPLEAQFKVDCVNKECEKVDTTEYQSKIGALMYLAITTRPDIIHSVSKLAQRNSDPHKEHEVGIKRLLRYLKGTIDFKLHYMKTGQPTSCFVDADWAGDGSDRKSYTGFVFMRAGGAISWEAKKQNVVALSSTEAEYIAMSSAAKEATFITKLIMEMGIDEPDPMILNSDNQSAQHLVKNPKYHARSKHIDIKYHHIRDLYKDKFIDLNYVSTEVMYADILTKNLQKIKHQRFTKDMGLY